VLIAHRKNLKTELSSLLNRRSVHHNHDSPKA